MRMYDTAIEGMFVFWRFIFRFWTASLVCTGRQESPRFAFDTPA